MKNILRKIFIVVGVIGGYSYLTFSLDVETGRIVFAILGIFLTTILVGVLTMYGL